MFIPRSLVLAPCAAVLASMLGFLAPAHATYSIVARDPATGELGVAVQSHWFNVGSIVPWAEAGVGAVATQANADPGYGPRALALLRDGKTASEALAALLAKDAEREFRQVAIVDAKGQVAVHTGNATIAAAGHETGAGFSVQANIMENASVWPAMSKAFTNTKGPLAERLLATLDAAQAAGGDLRGQQSAAILVVGGTRTTEPWTGVRVNLRVDDAKAPLDELRRLLVVARAYERANEGDALTTKKDFEGAARAYLAAAALYSGNDELVFWASLSQAAAGKPDEAGATLEGLFKKNAAWKTLLSRLRATDSLGVPPMQRRFGLPVR